MGETAARDFPENPSPIFVQNRLELARSKKSKCPDARRPEKKRPRRVAGASSEPLGGTYLPAVPSWVDTVLNVFFSWPPSEFTTVMMATEMPAAMRPYSMAVAPDSSFMKCCTKVFIGYSW